MCRLELVSASCPSRVNATQHIWFGSRLQVRNRDIWCCIRLVGKRISIVACKVNGGREDSSKCQLSGSLGPEIHRSGIELVVEETILYLRGNQCDENILRVQWDQDVHVSVSAVQIIGHRLIKCVHGG